MLKKLSLVQSVGWAWSAFVFGLCLIGVFFGLGPGSWGSYGIVEVGVFIGVWLFGTFGIRLYIQDKDPTNLRELLGLKPKK